MTRTFNESYAPRLPEPGWDCNEIEGVGACWGPVRDSSSGKKCEGHRGLIYRSEPVPPTEEELRLRAQAQRKKDSADRLLKREIAYKWGYSLAELEEELSGGRGPKEWDKWQEGRWFRRFTYGLGKLEVGPFWKALSDPMLRMIHSTLGEGTWEHRVPKRVVREVLRLGAYATREIQIRRLRFPDGPYNLKLAPEEWEGMRSNTNPAYTNPFTDEETAIKAKLLTDVELRILDAIVWQVVDYSCLERGVRQLTMSLYSDLRDEHKRRGLPEDGLLEEVELPIPPMILPRHPDVPPSQPSPPALGYWWWAHEPMKDLPHPEDYIDLDWSRGERATVVRHLRQGESAHQWMGSSSCRICNDRTLNGSQCFTDGTYVWPEGFAHYVEIHGVKPDQKFIDHVLHARGVELGEPR